MKQIRAVLKKNKDLASRQAATIASRVGRQQRTKPWTSTLWKSLNTRSNVHRYPTIFEETVMNFRMIQSYPQPAPSTMFGYILAKSIKHSRKKSEYDKYNSIKLAKTYASKESSKNEQFKDSCLTFPTVLIETTPPVEVINIGNLYLSHITKDTKIIQKHKNSVIAVSVNFEHVRQEQLNNVTTSFR